MNLLLLKKLKVTIQINILLSLKNYYFFFKDFKCPLNEDTFSNVTTNVTATNVTANSTLGIIAECPASFYIGFMYIGLGVYVILCNLLLLNLIIAVFS